MCKKFIIIFFGVCIPFIPRAQFVVSDPALEELAVQEALERQIIQENSIKHLNEALTQTEKMSSTVRFLKENYDRLKTVNTAIQKLDNLGKAMKRQKRAVDDAKKLVKEFQFSDVINPEEYQKINGVLLEIVKSIREVVKAIDLVLGDTQMSDGERMMLLKQYEDELEERQTQFNNIVEEYRSLKNKRIVAKIQQKIANR